jgi:hypothetical protein
VSERRFPRSIQIDWRTTCNQNDDLHAERERLQAEIARLQVARDTGVPVGVLRDASTMEDAQALAQQALAWRGDPAPAPPPTAARYLPNQINRETLPYLSPQEISEAHRRGQLEGIGAPAPPPRNARP